MLDGACEGRGAADSLATAEVGGDDDGAAASAAKVGGGVGGLALGKESFDPRRFINGPTSATTATAPTATRRVRGRDPRVGAIERPRFVSARVTIASVAGGAPDSEARGRGSSRGVATVAACGSIGATGDARENAGNPGLS